MLKSKIVINLFILSLVLTLIFVIVHFFIKYDLFRKKEDFEKFVKEQEKILLIHNISIEGIKIIKSRWEYGDLEGNFVKNLFNCPEDIVYKSNIDDFYLRCNPNYIQCFYSAASGVSDPSIKVRLNNKEYHVQVNQIFKEVSAYSNKKRFYKIVSRPVYGIMMNISIKEFPNYSRDFILENNCDQIYLPRRKYSSEGHTWDNFNKDIFVDRFLVSYRDVLEWVSYAEGDVAKESDKQIIIPKEREFWATAATNLHIEQMKRYCAFKGKQLMEAHIYDAASFYPSNQEDPYSIDNMPSIYPWTKDITDSFIYRYKQMYIRNRGNSKMLAALDLMLKEEDCDLAYVRDCIDRYTRKYYSGVTSSWMGMSDILGGEMEYMNNIFEKDKNLKLSSKHLDVLSKWHSLGQRATYSEEKNEITAAVTAAADQNMAPEVGKDLNLNYNDLDDIMGIERPYKIGFRCMQIQIR
ncbi:MAG: hypothetical protein HQK51_04110 [Oligoflexia bacterium]|nr:hypothetical protein [Oligoflexia bacterium]